jgi:hypothetical protein
MTQVKHMKWWGWGKDGVGFHYDDKPAFAPFVLQAVGLDLATAVQAQEPSFADLSVPASNAKAALLKTLTGIVGAEHVLKLLPKGTHEYAKFIKPSELAAQCRAASLDVADSSGLEYNPITRRYWLSDNTSVNYMLACRKPA